MLFIPQLLNYSTIAIAGLEKNSGKTTCMNSILKIINDNYNKKVAITSIGIDGETLDQVTATHKPEIIIYKGMLFVTSEKFYLQKQLDAKILFVSKQSSAMGRMVIAEAINEGKCIIAGPDKNSWLKDTLLQLNNLNADISIIDGAISRSSHASPSIADALVLCTGAVISPNIDIIVRETKHWIRLIETKVFDNPSSHLDFDTKGVWVLDNKKNIWKKLNIESLLMINKIDFNFFKDTNTVFTSGAITDKMIETLISWKKKEAINLVVSDFTKIFLSARVYNSFLNNGNSIFVLKSIKLLGLCINPQSPEGFKLSSKDLSDALSAEINYPIVDVKNK